MKKLLIYVLLAASNYAVLGCKKEKIQPASTELVGEWNWVSSSGGFTGNQTATPASTGVATCWVFKRDSTFQQFDTKQGKSQLVESTTYSLSSKHSIYTVQPARALTINRRVRGAASGVITIQPVTYIIQEVGEQLKVADNNFDGFGHTYRRK